jgi:hypothetical protein
MRISILFITLFLVGCSPKFKIQSDTPFPGDFKNYHSFKFFNPNNMPASNFSFDENSQNIIFDAAGDEMKAKGYKSIQDADLMIKIYGGTKSSVEIQNDDRYYPNSYNSYNYNRYGSYDDHYDRPQDQSKKESSIIIDIIDIKKDKIIWQGVGVGSFGKKESLTEIAIREAISSIFTKYPYTAGSSL